jgi:hypothetical protein
MPVGELLAGGETTLRRPAVRFSAAGSRPSPGTESFQGVSAGVLPSRRTQNPRYQRCMRLPSQRGLSFVWRGCRVAEHQTDDDCFGIAGWALIPESSDRMVVGSLVRSASLKLFSLSGRHCGQKGREPVRPWPPQQRRSALLVSMSIAHTTRVFRSRWSSSSPRTTVAPTAAGSSPAIAQRLRNRGAPRPTKMQSKQRGTSGTGPPPRGWIAGPAESIWLVPPLAATDPATTWTPSVGWMRAALPQRGGDEMARKPLMTPDRDAQSRWPDRPTYSCPKCGHVLRVSALGRHRVYFELDDPRFLEPAMNRTCPVCSRRLPGTNPAYSCS